MSFRWFWRLGAVGLTGVAAGGLVLVLRTSPESIPKPDIRTLATGLNEAAAIGVPHFYLLSDDERKANGALLARVEAGEPLDAADSAAYRRVFQNVLFQSQKFLSRFDAELTVLDNHAAHAPNNVAAEGITGHHDHHDVSARLNFAAMIENLRQLSGADSTFARIRLANVVQKDLVDLISHLGVAPHTVSVAYVPPAEPWSDPALGAIFEAMLVAFKAAQFEPIHSPAYWAAIDRALDLYADLIFAVQGRVQAATSPLERRISGRFLSPQTLAPPVDLDRPRRKR
ncbi:MAG: hypothetical protein LCH61_09050 [Proteobacteria bacterium]|nr:hypothetical protein [Pseudomonadota bacterium]